MKIIKKTREKMRDEGIKEAGGDFLRLGVKQDGGGVKSTGSHKVKLLAEPELKKGTHFHTGVERQELHFRLEEGGQEKAWSIPIYSLDEKGNAKKDDEGNITEHYLLPRLEPIEVGEEFTLELKGKGGKNFVEVTREGEQGEDEEFLTVEEGEDLDDSNPF